VDPVEAVLIGAGNRGRHTYGAYALRNPQRLRIVAVADPVEERRQALAQEHGLSAGAIHADWEALLEREPEAAVVIVATGDTLHVPPTLAALGRGYHVLLEKPMALEPAECVELVEATEREGRILQIAHVLRYVPFYRKVKEILDSGALGQIVHLELKENVAFWHMTHSYVRGKFRNRRLAAPIVLAKTCHDLDLLAWFVGAPARRVFSAGSLSHFRAEQAPEGAPERCTEGCPVQAACPHDAARFYLGPDEGVAALWPWSDLSAEPSRDARSRALETSPYGRCVYRCDNDVPDHQVVLLEFEGDTSASLTVHGLASRETRTLRITGGEGELRGVLQDGVLELTRHGSFHVERFQLEGSVLGHYGGDDALLDHFTDAVARGAHDEILASGRVSLESHLMGFAAEQARLRGGAVEMDAIRSEAARGAPGAP
jgi:predicted dehydrogenase